MSEDTENNEEPLYSFEDGPYEILNYVAKANNNEGKVVIDINDGDLGRLPIESLEAVEELREMLNDVEEFIRESQRKKEEL